MIRDIIYSQIDFKYGQMISYLETIRKKTFNSLKYFYDLFNMLPQSLNIILSLSIAIPLSL